MEKKEDNKYYQLVEDIVSGGLSKTTVISALNQSIKKSKLVPDDIKDLYFEIIQDQIKIMDKVLIKLELAYRRGNHKNYK